MLVVLEHRFYGQSWPSRNSSMEVLQLLTSQNALADAAYFIDDFTASRGLNGSNWVAFGGSYAGNLAAWMKQKYPDVVKTAVASSGPLLAVYDFPGYLETVSEVVKALDSPCYDKVYDAFNCMESLVNGSSCGNYTSASEIIPALRQCNSVDFGDLLDRETFFNILAMGGWADNWPSSGVRRNCAIINRVAGSDPLSLYGNFLVEMGEGGNCKVRAKSSVEATEEVLKFIRSEEGKQSGAAGWFWQTCYEFGYYMSADPKNGLFGYSTFSGWPYGISCGYEFGPSFTKAYTEERIAMTNEYYKAKNIDSKCVILVNGEYDPWHTLGINSASETSPDNYVVYVPQAEHCDDMLNPKTEEMRKAQALIQTQIGIYLNDSNC
ncbi:Thymus-specific serine protease [Orchesella cincta]|uniref:Thymus-specific serine protease n=1 Tax=Orchesella cincta TaxID=48709 RepID=A0A1D2MR90_ORCCI|nr:Thymus-specific serine protease [Orchesella cincta]